MFSVTGCTGSLGQDMGLTLSQDALLNLPQSQPDHGDNGGAGVGANSEQAQADVHVSTQ